MDRTPKMMIVNTNNKYSNGKEGRISFKQTFRRGFV